MNQEPCPNSTPTMPGRDMPRWAWSCTYDIFGDAASWDASLHFSAWPPIFRNPGGKCGGIRCASYFQIIAMARYWPGGSRHGTPDQATIRANYDEDMKPGSAPLCLWRRYMQNTAIRAWLVRMAKGDLQPLWPKMEACRHLALCGAPRTIVREAQHDRWFGIEAIGATTPHPRRSQGEIDNEKSQEAHGG